MRTVRIFFTKLGRARFISHLDINRCMARAVRRANIPLWYTEGFNPHPYMTFSLPLSLGIESLCESMDIRIEGEMGDDEIKKRLNAVMPEGISVVRAAEPRYNPKEITYAVYDVTLASEQPEELAEKMKAALQSDTLMAEKKGKQGRRRVIKEVDLKEYIESWAVETKQDAVVLQLLLLAGSSKNVNPVLLLETLGKKADVQVQAAITRRELLITNKTCFQ